VSISSQFILFFSLYFVLSFCISKVLLQPIHTINIIWKR